MDFYSLAEIPGAFVGIHPVAAATIIATGGLVAMDAAGNSVNAGAAVTGFVIGRGEEGVDNSAGAAGDKGVLVRRGVYGLSLDDANPPTKAHVGKMVYATAPDVVAHTGTCRAGRLIGFTEEGKAMVDTSQARAGTALVLGNANGEIGGLAIGAGYNQAEVTALRDKCEELADDVRAMAAILVAQGILV